MEHPTRVGNRLLAALPPADFDLLAPHLRNVSLERDAMLVRSGDRIEQIYFPRSGTIAFMLDMPNGQTVATAVIGNEGAVGVLTSLGPSPSPMTAVVRVAGTSLQISPARFFAALSHSSALRHVVQVHTRALLAQFQHVAACNALHSVEARMARWLLHIHDRVDGDFLPLTQEALSELLGRCPTMRWRSSPAERTKRMSLARPKKRDSRRAHLKLQRTIPRTQLSIPIAEAQLLNVQWTLLISPLKNREKLAIRFYWGNAMAVRNGGCSDLRVTFENGLPAYIMAIDGTWRRDCIVNDVSEMEATMTVNTSIEGLQLNEFFLLLSSTGLAYRRCSLKWVNGEQIGVALLRQKGRKKAARTSDREELV
jgi:CRP-like cAMP-binding protein